jgi:hypothetical protein
MLSGRRAARAPARAPGHRETAPRLAEYRDRHAGETLVVCGCGTSLRSLAQPERFVTIGVNDVGRLFEPTYLVVLNPRTQFAGDRFHHVETSRARAIFSQLDLGLRGRQVVRFRLGRRGGADVFASPGSLPYTSNSPYVAVCLAAYMGARRIGLIGVDLTDDHFFARTGAHPLARSLSKVDAEYGRLRAALAPRGIELVNLSATSRLTSLPRAELDELREDRPVRPARVRSPSLSIVSYATTPVAGVPSILARCIDHATPHRARCVWATSAYGNGVAFRSDVEWRSRPEEARALLAAADLAIVHNGRIDPAHRGLLAGKPVLVMAHNYGWNVDLEAVRGGAGRLVVGQYQATLPEFAGWTPVPNPVPLWEREFSPGAKAREITLCYTPSGRHESYAEGHRLHWHSKGYRTTMQVLARLAERWPIRLEVIGSRQVTHAQSLAMKRRAHIVIDECVTGSYHRNSLEGLAAGCLVVNGLGIRPQVEEALRVCAPRSEAPPFVRARLATLEQVLEELIRLGEPELRARGAANRAWMDEHWRFEEQWQRSWQPEIDRALERPRAPTRATARPRATPRTSRTAPSRGRGIGASVVIPHGSRERLPLLETTLRHLRQCEGIVDVVVVELDEEPFAEPIARSLASAYVYRRHHGTFHKARAMNIGAALATCTCLLWLDHDILIEPGLAPRALDEMARRQLDCLVPWSSVRYLSERDSRAVIAGSPLRRDVHAHRTYSSRHGVCGGAVLVRRSFVERHGGVPEEFRGWGGEDSAFWLKVQRLGRAAVTERRGESLHHLYHALSGGYARGEHIRANPFYRRNFELLQRARSARSARQMRILFPPPPHPPLPWDPELGVLIQPGVLRDLATQVRDELRRRFGAAAELATALTPVADSARADACVLLGTDLAATWLGDESRSDLAARSVVVHDRVPAGAAELSMLTRAGAHLALTREVEDGLERAGLRPWNGMRADDAPPSPRRALLKLVQPLSVAIGRGESAAAHTRKGSKDAS